MQMSESEASRNTISGVGCVPFGFIMFAFGLLVLSLEPGSFISAGAMTRPLEVLSVVLYMGFGALIMLAGCLTGCGCGLTLLGRLLRYGPAGTPAPIIEGKEI